MSDRDDAVGFTPESCRHGTRVRLLTWTKLTWPAIHFIAISAKIAAAKIAKQLRKRTMFAPFQALKRALVLKVQML
jgi:hypothetical protein